jgi:hypothetical protein
MQSFENKPGSPTRRPGASLNVDTGYKNKSKAPSPPRTPNTSATRIGKGSTAIPGRALKIRTGPRETFLDDIMPIDAGRYHASERMGTEMDSHDLSLSPREATRDSLVDHMLLSFDQLSLGQEGGAFGAPLQTHDEDQLYSAFGEEENYPTYTAARNNRPLGHGHSYSSDFEGHEAANRSSSQLTRGRRSNSSSNFQTGLTRLNSLRNEPNSSSSGTVQRANQSQPRAIHSRSGKGSKGSSANSFDLGYAQVTSSQRWAHGIGGRSSSFDFGQDRQMLNRQINTAAPYTATTSFFSDDYDAAPTPTVPVGPRRQPPMSPGPIYSSENMPPPPIPKTLERKRSTRSSKSMYKGPADGINGFDMSYSQGTHENTRKLPPLPAFVKEAAAPAPLVGYGKTKGQGNQSAPASKPGFFRRVFGSSKNHHAPTPEPTVRHDSATSVETADRTNGKSQHIASQMMSQQPPPAREPPPPPKDQSHVLTKRPSSFFRRRRNKSISEPEAPPPVPPPPCSAPPLPPAKSDKEDLALRTLPSPVSSLRQVMNQYLEKPGRSPVRLTGSRESNMDEALGIDVDEDLTGLSPDYSPNANSTIRAIKPLSREGCEEGMTLTSGGPTRDRLDADVVDQHPNTGIRIEANELPDVTFLQESSDNDREGPYSATRSLSPSKDVLEKRGVSPIPPESVARDMALVAEYERTHSKRLATPVNAGISISNDSLLSSTGSKSSLVKSTLPVKDEEWVMLTPTRSTSDREEKEDRVWLEPTSSEEQLPAPASNLSLPLEGARASARTSGSTSTGYKSAISLAVAVDGDEAPERSPRLLTAVEAIKSLDEFHVTSPDIIELTDGDRERARKIYDGNEDFIQKEKAAAWLGEEGLIRQRTRVAYMELYDFANLNILAALRILCGRLILKAETQQVDRILDGFSKRWCQCNPNHGFKSADVVHTICYSILLLNTDLHLADIESKMTRSQFVKNTLPTILRVVADAAPDAFEPSRPSILPSKTNDSELLSPVFKPSEEHLVRDNERPSWRSSIKPPLRQDSDGLTRLNYNTPTDDCGPLVKAPFNGTLRTWEVQVEIVLKDFYGSIRDERLPLFGATTEKQPMQQASQNSLSVFTNGMLRRSPSVLSKTPSESLGNNRGRTADTVRLGTGKWASKNRSRPRVYPSSGMGSSRTSLDDQSSMWSPSVSSSTWSKYSLGKTHTSMSVDSFGSNYPQGDYQQSIGFANALSQAIIREETVGPTGSNGSDDLRAAPLLEDESLELAGAPWAKEGLVKHKHHLEALDKKAKDRNWNEAFAVIEKGYMSLFSFSSKSLRNKSKSKATGGVVGGGNWQDNAENLGSFLLRQTIASALPPPGYSKARPHVWALSLPTGAVHLFQVGTPEIVREFVSTANYWSARLSNHPLVGGISNIEYGWSDAIINNSLVQTINDTARPSTSGPRPSLQSSLRSSLDHGTSNFRSRLPGDKVSISEWTPPTQSMRASNLMEQDQLRTLIAYVQGIEDELTKHNQLRSSMLLAVSLILGHVQ